MREAVLDIIYRSLDELGEGGQIDVPDAPDENTRLFAPKGLLDSLGLVALISEIEERISDEMARDIILADERSMSQKTSPFRSVRALVSYVEKLLESPS